MNRSTVLFVMHPSSMRSNYRSPLFHSNACYQLKAWLESCPEIAARFEVEVARFDDVPSWNHGYTEEDDLHVLDRILRNRPAILCFSLYAWNVVPLHSLLLAVKHIAPETVTIAGGPELYDRASFAEEYPGFDFLVEGDGERPLRQLLARFHQPQPDYSDIPNVSVRHGDRWTHNPKKETPADQDAIPDYYRANADLLYGSAFFLTNRGCSHDCDYCLWARQPMSRKRREKAIEELETLLLGGRIMHLTLFDYDLLDVYRSDSELFHSLVSLRQRANPRLQLRSFTSPHRLRDPNLPKIVHDLALERLIIGVQSTNPSALTAVRRGWTLRQGFAFDQVPEALRPLVLIELMFPLPGESSQSFHSTLRHLLSLGYFHLRIFNLMVFRGTRLHRNREALGLRVLQRPPYLCFETPTVPFPEFLRSSMLAHVLALLCAALEPFNEEAQQLSGYFRTHPELVDRILAGIDAGREPDDLLGELVDELVGIRYEGGFCNRDFDGAAEWRPRLKPEVPPQVEPPMPHLEPAQAVEHSLGASFRGFFDERGLSLKRTVQTSRGIELTVGSGDASWSVVLGPRRLHVPHYCTTRFYQISYSGQAPLEIVDAFAAFVRSLELSRRSSPEPHTVESTTLEPAGSD
jgi:radical SAM superfamily enzyme YgiQ (UPF0313 family)